MEGLARPPVSERPARRHRPWYTVLYVQVLIAIALGVAIGHFYPKLGKALKPLGDGFIALIKMMIAPVIFCTVVHGIASMSDLKKVGRVGIKTLFYFEAVSTLALAIGLIVGEVVQPGSGFNIDPATLDPKAVASYVTTRQGGEHRRPPARHHSRFLFGALARGDLLQVLLISILTGFAIALHGRARPEGDARRSTPRRASSSASSGSSCGPRRSARSAPWRSRSARYGLDSLWNLLSPGRDLLFHQHPVRARRARHDRAPRRVLDLPLHRLHQGRAPDRARHQLVGDRAAAHDAEDGASRRVEIGGRPGGADRLQLQSRRHQHLHDARDALSGAGHQYAAHASPSSSASWRSP